MNEFWTDIGHKLIKIAIGLAVGAVVAISKGELGIAAISTCLTILILECIELKTQLRKLQDAGKNLVLIGDYLSKTNADTELFLTAIKLSYDPKKLHDEVWRELTKLLRGNYCATNYIAGIYKDQGENIVKLQVAKQATRSVEFEKIFFVDDDAEVLTDSFKEIVNLHRSKSGSYMKLHWLRRGTMTSDRNISKLVKAVGGIENTDFAVFDKKIVMRWRLDENRDVIKWSLVIGDENSKPYLDLFRALQEKSRPCPST
jgi:hypothetical protein